MVRNIFISFLDLLLFSNLFIAICAMAQGALTYLLLEAPINPIVIALLGCSTFILYNFSLILSKPENFKTSPYRRVRWFFAHYKLLIFSSLCVSLAIPFLITKLSINSLSLLAITGVLALSYNSPVLKFGNHRFGLRKLPGAKIFIISFVWAFSCVWLPIMELNSQNFGVSKTDTFLLVSKRFLFIMAITLPFDIRDLYQDRLFHLKTIPVLIGKKNALRLCHALLAIYVLFIYFFSDSINSGVVALTLTTILTGVLVYSTKNEKKEYYYFLLLDGTLLLQFVAVWIAKNLS
jgi:4-hydroxybenzoate polyprenyltransferase